ncbi:MAG: hypothetical protein DI603_22335 [Roseateles depolymerans]|uniref:Glycosyl transferase family 1 domain-containing protein n=1 Tax=Roseateles depolymerans TaxID=76731 RepID=A0A2W5D9R6_9BURK|nr:MAG: hypothetical protein DI603_22335 [Roseateles depolymerans]
MNRVGILAHGFIDWGGGLDFLRLIIGSLAVSEKAPELHLLLPTRGPRLMARRLLNQVKFTARKLQGRPMQRAVTPDAAILAEFARSSGVALHVHQIDSGSAAIQTAVRRLKLDAVLPASQVFDLPATPWLGYIADLQHAHLPQFFAPEDIDVRNKAYQSMLEHAPSVIVNARAVAHDIARLFPEARARVVALPFSAAPRPEWLEWNEVPLERYGIESPYFIISNQFWQHKDHLTAFRALALLGESSREVQLVCTGEPHDFRNPDHFPMLMREAASLGIKDRLRVLGLIPKRDQIALMRASLAVVQPTLFEGGPGGGAVFDAVALGIPAIVSDIPVNREIDEPNVSFFHVSEPTSLAERMQARLRQGPAPASTASELLANGLRRRRACGDTLLAALAEAQGARPH